MKVSYKNKFNVVYATPAEYTFIESFDNEKDAQDFISKETSCLTPINEIDTENNYCWYEIYKGEPIVNGELIEPIFETQKYYKK